MNIFGVWPRTQPVSSSLAGVGATVRTSMFARFHANSSVSADVEKRRRKRKRTGAMLLPCQTPTLWAISHISLAILSSTMRLVYIVLMAATNLGGAPYFSKTFSSGSRLAVSY